MPIFQLKPSGAMAGSMKWPRRPMTLSASCGADERARGGVDDGQMREHPERQGDGDDDGAGLAHEDARAVDEAQAEREAEWACGTAAARG